MKKNLQFYIIANFERGNVRQPVILYENGAVEIPSILPSQKHYLGKQYYDCIEENLSRLKYRKRDLRKDFRPVDRYLYFFEVLEKIRNQKTISLSKLWKFFYKNKIEKVISATLEAIVKKRLSRLISKSFKQKPRDNIFLRKIGYIK